MRRNRVRLQLAVFAAMSILIVGYTLFAIVGVSVGTQGTSVLIKLARGGGAFSGSDVLMRGVHVGRVTSIDLADKDVTLHIVLDSGVKVPSDATANIYELSVVGEQYVDLVPGRDSGPYLTGGALIPANRTSTPISTSTLLTDTTQMLTSINPADVGTVTRELSAAFAGTGPEMRDLIANANDVLAQLNAARGATISILENGSTLLDTAARHSGDFAQFSTSLLALSDTLRTSTPTFEKFVDEGLANTQLMNQLITENANAVTVLLGNVATVSGIQVATVPGLQQLLVALPQTGNRYASTVENGRFRVAPLFNLTEPICQTGVPLTSPLSGQKTPVNVAAHCLHPVPGELVRGAANAPSPNGYASGASFASMAASPSAQENSTGTTQVTTFDPATNLVTTHDGSVIQLGSTGGQQTSMGSRSWEALLQSPMKG